MRNGTHQAREVLTSAGAVEVVAPRVNDRRTNPDTGERRRFSSAILPPCARKTPKVTEVLPLLYLHGLSSGNFVPALGQFRYRARAGDHVTTKGTSSGMIHATDATSCCTRAVLPSTAIAGTDPALVGPGQIAGAGAGCGGVAASHPLTAVSGSSASSRQDPPKRRLAGCSSPHAQPQPHRDR